MQGLDVARASLMNILRKGGALNEFTELQAIQNRQEGRLHAVRGNIDLLKRVDREGRELKVERELLGQRLQNDYDEREDTRTKAISAFNENSQVLYDTPGSFVVNLGPQGYTYGVEIEKSGSQGVDNMKVFCYDLMLARLWSGDGASPGFLAHDSIIFDGVDERQRASALELAAATAERFGYQYICTLNSDALPWDDFTSGFEIETYVRLRLTDDKETGSLLGLRF